MLTQTTEQRRNVYAILSQAIRMGLRNTRLARANYLWVPFDLNQPEVMSANDLPDFLRRDVGLFPKHKAPPTTQQLLELRLY